MFEYKEYEVDLVSKVKHVNFNISIKLKLKGI